MPCARFSTTKTGMEGVMMPVIGPTAARWWQGPIGTSPVSTRARAAVSSGAQPS